MNMINTLKQAEIIPDLFEHPDHEIELLKVTYEDIDVLCQEFSPTQVKKLPQIEIPKEEGLYTIMLSDPDTPARYTIKREAILHHWVVNIPGGGSLSDGTTLVEYIGSGAPKGTGLHRYVYMLLKQKYFIETEHFEVVGLSTQGRRFNRHLDIIKDYQLDLMATTFFSAQYDEYVKLLWSRIKID